MMYVLLFLLVIAVISHLYLVQRYKSKQREIVDVSNQLASIMEKASHERILLHTDDTAIQSLLVQINRLLDNNQKALADHKHIEQSMRKMLSNISHDLKTPLTVILGYTEMIHTDKTLTEDKRAQFLETIHIKTEEVLGLINRFFDLVKLESGDKTISCTKIEIGELSRKIILEYNEILIRQAFDVTIEIPEESIDVWGNEDALASVLHNLISNAIQYGADGKMLGLRIHVIDNRVNLEVIDQGKGISEIHRNRVFERMYTLEDSRNQQYQGSGLGLTITKRLVEQMEGTIALDSVPFQQTTFTVSLKRMHHG